MSCRVRKSVAVELPEDASDQKSGVVFLTRRESVLLRSEGPVQKVAWTLSLEVVV